MPIYQEVPQDTIDFRLTFETGLTLDTIRMTMPVHYALLRHGDGDDMMGKVRQLLKTFIPSADWNFSSIRRKTGEDGIERVSLIATARVKTGEDADLKTRLDHVNTAGLTLGSPTVDYTFPLHQINTARATLREQLAKAAKAECEQLGRSLGRPFRLHSIEFVETDELENPSRVSSSASSYGQTRSASRGDDGGTIHSEKMFMTARVTAACIVPVPNGKEK